MLSVCTSTAWANHGGDTSDATKCFAFKGTIRQLPRANPHAWLYVQVEKPAGAFELWGSEFRTVGRLSRAGAGIAGTAPGAEGPPGGPPDAGLAPANCSDYK
jgi:Family of unknown function (DUF6152)